MNQWPFCQLIQTGEKVRDETHFVTRDIDNWYEYVVVPIDSETVVVSTKDITEKKSASLQIEEQRNLLDSILKNSSNGISVSKVVRGDSGEVIDALTILANEAAIKYIGLPKDIYLSKSATEIEPNIIGTPYYQACIRTLDTGEPFNAGRNISLTIFYGIANQVLKHLLQLSSIAFYSGKFCDIDNSLFLCYIQL